ncbi:MAG TPA: glutamine--tRNA ligase/YqeY domain fusion protein [Thermoanaerobaculia bacterium]|nr:glutamine--tRNA ligase/YqeY domain fusion protein [Thermoanaerobaculia bacterium]
MAEPEASPGAPSDPGGDAAGDFIRDIVRRDLASGKHARVVTRFPPEPNGHLHIGHAKSICLNFGLAEELGGVCNLRFDDSNPLTEDMEYVEAIQRDVRWLAFDWGERLYFASDYFDRLYALAEELIRRGKAYVDSQSEEEIRRHRGTVTEPGVASPYRERPPDESLELFRRMRAGDFADGAHVLRARIDMAAPNMKMRDPLLYRIRHAPHYRQGDAWCIYPMYDFIHPLSDAFEGITHSLCTLEFENNRELYDWLLAALDTPAPRPQQIEFARLNLSYTVMSKRKLLQLVEEGHVGGWDDPRMPTLAGLRRRGYPPSAIRAFCDLIGVAKAHSTVDVGLLEHAVRDDLNPSAPRVMCVLRPLKVVLTDYPEGEGEWLDAPHWPHDVPREGSRPVPFGRELWIERDDFRPDPPPGFHRLAPGREVRLRHGYVIRCQEAVRDAAGEVVELRCTHDPDTRGGGTPDGRRVPGTLHWVSAAHAVDVTVRLFDRLFGDEQPDRGKGGPDFRSFLNPDSLTVLEGCKLEPAAAEATPGSRLQFERLGYFLLDEQDSQPQRLVFHRIVTLRDTWARISQQREAADSAPARAAPAPPAAAPSHSPADPLAGLSPDQRRVVADFAGGFDLPLDDARTLTSDAALAQLFEEAVSRHRNPQGIANLLVNELLGALAGRPPASLPFRGDAIGELVALTDEGTISTAIAKEVLAAMVAGEGTAGEIVARRGLEQVRDRQALAPVVHRVVAAHPDNARAYRRGKSGLLGWFVGQVMRETGGRANPQLVNQLLEEELTAGRE